MIRFFLRMCAFDAGYVIGVVLGAITGAVAVIAAHAFLAIARLVL